VCGFLRLRRPLRCAGRVQLHQDSLDPFGLWFAFTCDGGQGVVFKAGAVLGALEVAVIRVNRAVIGELKPVLTLGMRRVIDDVEAVTDRGTHALGSCHCSSPTRCA
jgi:hypothetical protein